MLKSKLSTQLSDSTPVLWTQDESIAFECAQEAIGHVMAICSSLIAKEERSKHPCITRTKELKEKRSKLADERKELYFSKTVDIAAIYQKYGAKIRAYYEESGRCPV